MRRFAAPVLFVLAAILMPYSWTAQELRVESAHQEPVLQVPPTLREIANQIAVEHGLNPDQFVTVINCESGFNPNVIGDHGTSFGIAQFHHPERDWGFSTTTAMNPILAMNYMADAWVRGEQARWTCWRTHYGRV